MLEAEAPQEDLEARYSREDMAGPDDTKLKQVDEVKTEIPEICLCWKHT